MEKQRNSQDAGRPTTFQADLAKLPAALAPLIERPQWAIWRWTRKPDGSWQKPPFQARDPQRNASTGKPNTWTDYDTALMAVQAGSGEGISYILTPDDPFAALDLDRCRDPKTGSIAEWAQQLFNQSRTYAEISPSGTGLRIWGLAKGEKLHRVLAIRGGGQLELFRRTEKALP